MPRMPLSGVRISWLTVARNRDLAWLAASAFSRASTSSASVCLASVMFRPMHCRVIWPDTGSRAMVSCQVQIVCPSPSPSSSSEAPLPVAFTGSMPAIRSVRPTGLSNPVAALNVSLAYMIWPLRPQTTTMSPSASKRLASWSQFPFVVDLVFGETVCVRSRTCRASGCRPVERTLQQGDCRIDGDASDRGEQQRRCVESHGDRCRGQRRGDCKQRPRGGSARGFGRPLAVGENVRDRMPDHRIGVQPVRLRTRLIAQGLLEGLLQS